MSKPFCLMASRAFVIPDIDKHECHALMRELILRLKREYSFEVLARQIRLVIPGIGIGEIRLRHHIIRVVLHRFGIGFAGGSGLANRRQQHADIIERSKMGGIALQ